MPEKMKVGEKYLSIKLVGNSEFVPAFPNKDKTEGDNKPDYKGDGVAVWVKKKQEPKPEQSGI